MGQEDDGIGFLFSISKVPEAEVEAMRCGDMSGMTVFAEVVTLLQLSNRKPDAKIRIDVDLEEYYQIKDKKQSKES